MAPLGKTFVESHYVYDDSDFDKETGCARRRPYAGELRYPRRTTTEPKDVACPGCKALIAIMKNPTGPFIKFSNFRKHVKACSRLLEPRGWSRMPRQPEPVQSPTEEAPKMEAGGLHDGSPLQRVAFKGLKKRTVVWRKD